MTRIQETLEHIHFMGQRLYPSSRGEVMSLIIDSVTFKLLPHLFSLLTQFLWISTPGKYPDRGCLLALPESQAGGLISGFVKIFWMYRYSARSESFVLYAFQSGLGVVIGWPIRAQYYTSWPIRAQYWRQPEPSPVQPGNTPAAILESVAPSLSTCPQLRL